MHVLMLCHRVRHSFDWLPANLFLLVCMMHVRDVTSSLNLWFYGISKLNYYLIVLLFFGYYLCLSSSELVRLH